ncbi:hypothetical protein GF374_02305 [Candidatus Woesearchaeota archaeon]|nr:hypothetical protein [Candidatus Woesearchaeota archaeon]
MAKRKRKKRHKKTFKSKNFFEKAKRFLLSPKKAFKAERKTRLGETFKYGLIGLAILGILTGIIYLAFPLQAIPFAGPTLFLMLLVLTVIFGFIIFVIGGLWLHLWAYIFGARKGPEQTMKAYFYAKTPTFFLGWLPLISFIGAIWSVILEVIGLKQLQNMSTGRAAGAVIIAIIIPMIIFIILIFWVLNLAATTMGTIPSGMFNLPT